MTSEMKRGRKFVTRHYAGKTVHEEEELEVQTFDGPTAEVRVFYGSTKNLGDYNSVKIEAGVTLPTYVEEIPEAFDKAWDIATLEISRQLDSVKK